MMGDGSKRRTDTHHTEGAAHTEPLGAAVAVLVGHLVVTVPVLVIAALFAVGSWAVLGRGAVGALVGVVPAWIHWSLSVPRWRRWALRRGAPPDRLQRIASATGLVWPKGWVFGKTEARLPEREGD